MSVENLLGLAQKAGKLIIGAKGVQKALRQSKVFLVILASDGSERTKRNFRRDCDMAGISVVEILSKDSLGQRFNRSEIAIMGISDLSFAKVITNALQNMKSRE